MNAREIKGEEIARNFDIRRTSRGWIVPSQSGKGTYLVRLNGHEPTCTCPDCEIRKSRCKHIIAVELLMKKELDSNGNVTTTKAVKVTYSQNWEAYRKAQNSELNLFEKLLADLVKNIPEPEQTRGRPRLSLQEQVFCAIEKVYTQLSSRRAYSLYRNAQENGTISKAPNSNAINKLLEREDIAPVLERLLGLSALPLKSVESTFAPDSSGFRTSQFNQYAIEKYGNRKKHKWVKCHILTGTRTNVIVSARITDENASDCPRFKPMVLEADSLGFEMKEIVADRGYLSRENYETAKGVGATAYIPFKSNVTGKARGSLIWKKMWHFFQFNNEEFMQRYHARSNVESCFNMVKMKFGDKLKSKGFTAQKNELLCKLIAHNIVVLIHEIYELNIKPQF
jgi:transposase